MFDETLFVIDVGNTQSVLGVIEGETLLVQWRTQTHSRRTSDEYGMLISQLFDNASIPISSVTGIIISCVVPPMHQMLVDMSQRYFKLEPLVVEHDFDTGLKILVANPEEVGADRIVNSVAAYNKHQCGLIIVDFGTATTFDVVTPRGEYAGGAIAPGLNISAEALVRNASKLPRIEILKPSSAVGTTTVSSMQSGIFFGYVGLVKELVQRIEADLDFVPKVIATGGIAPILAGEIEAIVEVDPFLTLHGLQILYERNLGKR